MKQFYLTIVAILFLLLIYSLESQSLQESEKEIVKVAPVNPYIQQFNNQFTEEIKNIQEEHNIPAVALVIVRDTSILFFYTRGVKSMEVRDSINKNTVFRLGSLSKGFAGLLTALEVEEGDLNWEDSVVDYVPAFKLKDQKQTNSVNLRHLLSHTTGLPYHTYTNLVEDGKSIDYILPRFSKVKLIGEPGEIYAYQNAVFGVISKVLEKATGEEIQYLLKRRIFDKLKMRDASSSFEMAIKNDNLALPHQYDGTNWIPRHLNRKYYNTIAAGGVNASIDDMAKWMLALLVNKPTLFSKRTLNNVFVPFVKTPVEHRYFSQWTKIDAAYYGMGWRVLKNNNQDVVYHSGLVNGYRSEIAINRTTKTGICILMNAPSPGANLFVPHFLDSYELYKNDIETWEKQLKYE